MAEENGNGNGSTAVRVVAGHDPEGRRVRVEIEGREPVYPIVPGKGARASRRQVSRTKDDITKALTGDVLRRTRDEQTTEAVRVIRDLDPQVSQAVWNYLRLMNPGNTLKAYTWGGDGTETEEEGAAQLVLDELVRRVGEEYGGGLDQLLNVLNLQLITHGAEALEVTPSVDGRDVFDWFPVDPTMLSFRRDGEELVLGQKFRNGDFVPVNPELVFYQPLDPDTDDPYGRMPLISGINAVMTKAMVLADLRAVSHNQGYPRIDVSVLWDAILAAAPPVLKTDGNQAALQEWANQQLRDIVSEYENLAVDDTFVHYNYLELKMVGGTAPASLGFNFKELIDILERQLNSALKMLPILQGSNQMTSEGHGSIQWQIQVAGVETLQRLTKRLIEKAGTVSLRIRGHAAHAKLVMDPIRSVDRLYEAQSDLFEAKAIQIDVMMGWRSNDEAALLRSGHKAVGDPVPMSANSDLNPNNSGDKTKGASENGPGAGGDEVQKPAEVESKSGAAYDLLMQELRTPTVSRNMRIGGFVTRRDTRPDVSNELVDKYAEQANLIFQRAQSDLLQALANEGLEIPDHAEEERVAQRVTPSRQQSRDIADYVFGLRYSRQMLALLREAISEGMERAGVDIEASEVPDRIVRRIWNENRQYVLKLRNDLRDALNSGTFRSLLDVRAWFSTNAWREVLMGRYLAKQGLEAGFAHGRSLIRGVHTTFRWHLGFNDNHCGSCLVRENKVYTADELLSVGYPGSGALICGANCHCTLEELE